jgi:ABC-type sulfate/molybdate transport systems ATPase subunit
MPERNLGAGERRRDGRVVAVLEVDVEVERRDLVVAASVSVGPGERLGLFGPSGAGKSTILEAIAGLVWPTQGRVRLNGKVLTRTGPDRIAVEPWRRRIGLLRQSGAVFPHLSVRENLLYGRRSLPDGVVLALADELGLAGLLDARPGSLSGGQLQRVALGRALLAEPAALLLDEPFAALDAERRAGLGELVRRLVERERLPTIMVSHDLTEIQHFADRIGVLDAGKLLQVDEAAAVVRRPATRRVAELVGYASFVPVACAEAGRPETVVMGIHPDQVELLRAPEPAGVSGAPPVDRETGRALSGVVVGLRPSGGGVEVEVAVSGTRVFARLARSPAGAGDPVTVVALAPIFFDGQGRRAEP